MSHQLLYNSSKVNSDIVNDDQIKHEMMRHVIASDQKTNCDMKADSKTNANKIKQKKNDKKISHAVNKSRKTDESHLVKSVVQSVTLKDRLQICLDITQSIRSD